MIFNNIFSSFLDFIYKKSCIICHSKKENSFLCQKCKEKIEKNSFSQIKIIDNVKIYSCCIYSGIPQKLVRLLKFHNKRFLAKDIAKISFEYINSLNIDLTNCEIIAVPLHQKKKRKRGFNQCELISEELSNLLNIPCNFNLIKRIKNTKSMYKLKIQERKENLKDAFFIDEKFLNNKKYLIIDDILTTGTTFEEMIKELKKHNISDIICFSFTNTEKNSIFIK